jgi:hypothetical protein
MNNTEIVKVKVKFVYSKQFDEVTAVFINEFTDLLDCYAHIGQHSICSKEWVNEQKPATKKQYLPLLKELQSIGYEVEILKP